MHTGSHWRCSRHLSDELSKKGKTGGEDLEVYSKLYRIPKNHLGLTSKLYEDLSADSGLRAIPHESIMQTHMPEGERRLPARSHISATSHLSTFTCTLLVYLSTFTCTQIISHMHCTGRCLHGNTTNNAAEIFNSMAMAVREQETPYRSLLAAVHLLEERQRALSVVVARCRAATGGEEWGPTTLVPYVEAEHDRL
jgi:hypothetical protein